MKNMKGSSCGKKEKEEEVVRSTSNESLSVMTSTLGQCYGGVNCGSFGTLIDIVYSVIIELVERTLAFEFDSEQCNDFEE
ncbi:hypothetical protein EAG_16183 [Camponotus floridanus]|uniref:Uncharacterized protein n=1 Tax=Camponotus floridanus TaxID=104421 RepID=E2AGK2_CAMFO|nr:hypothetical protein EAG_16183 [Camponotus floridanus]